MKSCLMCGEDCRETFTIFDVFFGKGPETYVCDIKVHIEVEDKVMSVCPDCLAEVIEEYADWIEQGD